MLAVTLRRFRLELAGAVVALAAVGVLALVTGTMMSRQYHDSGLATCLAGGSGDCEQLRDAFGRRFESLQVLIVPLVLLPALLGAFVGAPLVARELESGTHRFLWTQGVTRARWFAASATGALVLAAVAGAAYAVIAARWLDVTNAVTGERFGRMYDFQGVLPVGAAVFAVAVGMACGVVLRRTLPAMAVTVGIVVGVRLLLATQLRPRFASPRTADIAFGAPDGSALEHSGAWIVSRHTLTAAGDVLGTGGSLDVSSIRGCAALDAAPPGRLPDPAVVDRCLSDLEVHEVIRYQPAGRFWTFQLLESGALVALAMVAIVIAARSLPRRAV